jgi:diamine N-acetyltransferase
MIKSDNIILRALEIADADILYQWENDMSIWHLSNTLTPFSRFTLEQYIVNAHQDIFTIKQLRLMIDLATGPGLQETIGSIDLFEFDPNNMRAGLGILIHKDHRNKGHASKALDMMIDYAFTTLHLHQLYCNIGEENTESLRLFQNKKFKVVGTKEDWIRVNSTWHNELLLQLINTDAGNNFNH